jgi:hypothetical protein
MANYETGEGYITGTDDNSWMYPGRDAPVAQPSSYPIPAQTRDAYGNIYMPLNTQTLEHPLGSGVVGKNMTQAMFPELVKSGSYDATGNLKNARQRIQDEVEANGRFDDISKYGIAVRKALEQEVIDQGKNPHEEQEFISKQLKAALNDKDHLGMFVDTPSDKAYIHKVADEVGETFFDSAKGKVVGRVDYQQPPQQGGPIDYSKVTPPPVSGGVATITMPADMAPSSNAVAPTEGKSTEANAGNVRKSEIQSRMTEISKELRTTRNKKVSDSLNRERISLDTELKQLARGEPAKARPITGTKSADIISKASAFGINVDEFKNADGTYDYNKLAAASGAKEAAYEGIKGPIGKEIRQIKDGRIAFQQMWSQYEKVNEKGKVGLVVGTLAELGAKIDKGAITDPDAVAYVKMAQGLVSMMRGAYGEAGAFTDRDADRLLGTLAQISTNHAVNQIVHDNVISIFDQKIASRIGSLPVEQVGSRAGEPKKYEIRKAGKK